MEVWQWPTNLLWASDWHDLTNWLVVDRGTWDGPAVWARSHRTTALFQDSNVYSYQKRSSVDLEGTSFIYTQGQDWGDVTIVMNMASTDNDVIGLLFSMENENTYYQLLFDRQAETDPTRLLKCVDGLCEVLAASDFRYDVNVWFKVALVKSGQKIKVLVDDLPKFDVTDPKPLQRGTVGLFCWANLACYYDDIIVDSTTSHLVEMSRNGMFRYVPPESAIVIKANNLNKKELSQEEYDTIETKDATLLAEEEAEASDLVVAAIAAGIGTATLLVIILAVFLSFCICGILAKRKHNAMVYERYLTRYEAPVHHQVKIMVNNRDLKKCAFCSCEEAHYPPASSPTDYQYYDQEEDETHMECQCGHSFVCHEGYLEWIERAERESGVQNLVIGLKRNKIERDLLDSAKHMQMTPQQKLLKISMLNSRLVNENRDLRDDLFGQTPGIPSMLRKNARKHLWDEVESHGCHLDTYMGKKQRQSNRKLDLEIEGVVFVEEDDGTLIATAPEAVSKAAKAMIAMNNAEVEQDKHDKEDELANDNRSHDRARSWTSWWPKRLRFSSPSPSHSKSEDVKDGQKYDAVPSGARKRAVSSLRSKGSFSRGSFAKGSFSRGSINSMFSPRSSSRSSFTNASFRGSFTNANLASFMALDDDDGDDDGDGEGTVTKSARSKGTKGGSKGSLKISLPSTGFDEGGLDIVEEDKEA